MSDERNSREDIYSKSVRAGKRTYFFDVRTTRGNDLYLTITESKRKYNDEGDFFYEKHKLFLYKEDFEKFSDGLFEAVDKIKELQATGEYSSESPMDRHQGEGGGESASTESSPADETPKDNDTVSDDISFEDL